MARNSTESAWATFWQLQALVVAARSESWADVEQELGVDKYRVLKAVERLASKLGVASLLEDISGSPFVPPAVEGIVNAADGLLRSYRSLEDEARGSDRAYWIRCNGYWAHVSHFLGAAIADVEADHPAVHVELVPDFGRHRDRGGAGLIADLRKGRSDIVIAPNDGEVSDLEVVPLYRWVVVAAVPNGHPVLDLRGEEEVTRGVLKASCLERDPLLVSPKGHRSRDLVDLQQSVARRFVIEAASPEPAALVSMARGGRRIAIIASDSVVEEWNNEWPVVVNDEGHVLGGEYRAYFRKTGQPREMTPILERLAQSMFANASILRERVERWEQLPFVGPTTKPRRARRNT